MSSLSARYSKIYVLGQYLAGALCIACPVDFHIGRTCPAIDGVCVTKFAGCVDRQTEVRNFLAILIPDQADSAAMWGMQVERDINLLASFEGGGEL